MISHKIKQKENILFLFYYKDVYIIIVETMALQQKFFASI